MEFINVVITCKEFNALPNEGGVLDQDQLIMRKLRIVDDALAEKQEIDRKKESK